MRISEVAKLTGLNVSGIRFYERKGLLTPERETESKYRDYTQEDVVLMKKILLYRKMGLSVDTIYLLLQGQADQRTVLQRQKSQLHSQVEELKGAMELCELVMKEENLEGEKLDQYLNYVHAEEKKGTRFAQAEELVEDLAGYTQEAVFHYDPWFAWLFRRPLLAGVLSMALWVVVIAVPLSHLLQVIQGKILLSVPLLLVYGIILAIFGAGFRSFRKAQRQYLDRKEEDV